MLRKSLTFLALAFTCLPTLAADTSFGTLDEYLLNLGGSKAEAQETASDKEHIFGMAQWSCRPQDSCGSGTRYVASVFVLEKMQDGRLREVTHSTPLFKWPETTKGVGLDETVRKRPDSFSISFHHFFSGNEEFTFARRNSVWLLAGIDCGFIWMEDGDEAVGDSRSDKSINVLTGRSIETRYKANRLRSRKEMKTAIHPVPLSNFTPYPEEGSVCP